MSPEFAPNTMKKYTDKIQYCPVCGFANPLIYIWCKNCGHMFVKLHHQTASQNNNYSFDGSFNGHSLIPYKNKYALIGYYFGVFSVIPFFLIGIIGLLLGLKGLKYSKLNAEVHGTTHAWVAIIAGGFFGIGYFILTLLLIIYRTNIFQ